MFNLTKEELNKILLRNPSLSIQGNHPEKVVSEQFYKSEAKDYPKKNNKYYNVPVYVFEDGFVFVDNNNKRKDLDVHTEVKEHGKVIDKFDSTKEYGRFLELKLLEKAGDISDLKRQVPLTIQQGFRYNNETLRPIVYRADFVYKRNGETIVEDVKGFDSKTGKWRTTETFELKWKLLEAKYPTYKFVIV